MAAMSGALNVFTKKSAASDTIRTKVPRTRPVAFEVIFEIKTQSGIAKIEVTKRHKNAIGLNHAGKIFKIIIHHRGQNIDCGKLHEG